MDSFISHLTYEPISSDRNPTDTGSGIRPKRTCIHGLRILHCSAEFCIAKRKSFIKCLASLPRPLQWHRAGGQNLCCMYRGSHQLLGHKRFWALGHHPPGTGTRASAELIFTKYLCKKVAPFKLSSSAHKGYSFTSSINYWVKVAMRAHPSLPSHRQSYLR